MSKHQKGRRHRTVNRTPRPVTGRRTHTESVARQATASAASHPPHRQHAEQWQATQAPASGAVKAPATVAAAAATATPSATAPVTQLTAAPDDRADATPGAATPASEMVNDVGPSGVPEASATSGGPELDRVFGPAREGGLGRNAAQTWRRLKERGGEGATLEELSEAVGYQQATVSKHMSGLAEHSLALQRDDRWYAASTAP